MSTGFVVCSACHREVHQDGNRAVTRGWRHCSDKTPLCNDATAEYPRGQRDVVGPYCGMDGQPPSEW